MCGDFSCNCVKRFSPFFGVDMWRLYFFLQLCSSTCPQEISRTHLHDLVSEHRDVLVLLHREGLLFEELKRIACVFPAAVSLLVADGEDVFGAKFLPELVFFRDGVEKVYPGRRGEGYLSTWLTRTSIQYEKPKEPVSIFGVFPSASRLDEFRSLVQQEGLADVAFGYTLDGDLGDHIECTSPDGHVERLEDWNRVRLCTFPQVVHLNAASVLDVFEFEGNTLIVHEGVEYGNAPMAAREAGMLFAVVPCESSLANWLRTETECGTAWVYTHEGVVYRRRNNIDLVEFLHEYHKHDTNSETYIPSEFPKLTLMYTSWCAACINVLDDFDEAANAIEQTLGVAHQKFDHRTLVASNYPRVILYFSKNDFMEYTGTIKVVPLLAWATTHAVSRAPPIHDEL